MWVPDDYKRHKLQHETATNPKKETTMSSNLKTIPVRSLEEEKTAIQIVTEMLDRKITELTRDQLEAFNRLSDEVRKVGEQQTHRIDFCGRLYLQEVKQAYRQLVYTEGRIEKLAAASNELDSFRRNR